MLTILSPHLDDAVLSCWSVLTGGKATRVVNVFTGAPEEGTGARWWDRMTGADDSAQRMRERIEEDRAALALTPATALNLGLLEEQYRDGDPPTDIVAALSAVIPADSELYAPAAMADHSDHALVRDAALSLRGRGAHVTLYADLPHAIRQGWPSWVTTRGVPEVDADWDAALAPAGVRQAAQEAIVRTLDHDAQARKLQAIREYASQYAGVDALAFRPLLDLETLRYEVFWPLC